MNNNTEKGKPDGKEYILFNLAFLLGMHAFLPLPLSYSHSLLTLFYSLTCFFHFNLFSGLTYESKCLSGGST